MALDQNSLAEIRRLLNQGQKIRAMKLYREVTGVGLKEAKEAVEAMVVGDLAAEAEVADAPITPAEPVSDLLLFKEPGSDKHFYLPRYRLATRQIADQQQFVVNSEDSSEGGGKLTLGLQSYPASAVEEAVRDSDAAVIPHENVVFLKYRRSNGEQEWQFGELERHEGQLEIALSIADAAQWRELQLALRESDRMAQLRVERAMNVSFAQGKHSEVWAQERAVAELEAELRRQKEKKQRAERKLAELLRREQQLKQNIQDRLRNQLSGSLRPNLGLGGALGRRSGRERRGARRPPIAQIRRELGNLQVRIPALENAVEEAQAAVEEAQHNLQQAQRELQRLDNKPAFKTKRVTLHHVIRPDPFVMLAEASQPTNQQGRLASVRLQGHLYHWDPAQPEVVFDLPDEFTLVRLQEPPHLPMMRLRFDTGGADRVEDAVAELEYAAEPLYDPERREQALPDLREQIGVEEIRFEPYPAAQPTFALTLPFEAEAEDEGPAAVNNILVSLETGIQAILRMKMDDFRQVFAALFGASTVLLRGEVYVETTQPEPEEIPLALRIEDLEPEDVYDAILDDSMATTFARPITVQAFFSPLSDLPNVALKQTTVAFRNAPDVTLTAEEPTQEVRVPRSIRAVVLAGLEGDTSADIDSYQYKLRFVVSEHGQTRFLKDEEWRTASVDHLLPEEFLGEMLR